MTAFRLQIPAFMTREPTPIAFSVALSGAIYRMRLVWDSRALPLRVMREGEPPRTGAWRLDLQTMTGAVVLPGRKVVLSPDLWGAWHYKQGVPAGRLRVSRTDGGTQDPGLYDLGGPVALDYVLDT